MQIAPSFLSCDFSKMGEELLRMDKAGADIIHLDVMDGHFVPNITFGAPVIKWARPYTKLPFDVHLMISEPHRYIKDFAQAGADIITFHVECDSNIEETISLIEECGVKPGLVIKPHTPASAVFPYIDKLYMVLVMTVEPGFGGQSFMADMLPKVKEIKDYARSVGKDINKLNNIIETLSEILKICACNIGKIRELTYTLYILNKQIAKYEKYFSHKC